MMSCAERVLHCYRDNYNLWGIVTTAELTRTTLLILLRASWRPLIRLPDLNDLPTVHDEEQQTAPPHLKLQILAQELQVIRELQP